MSEEDKVKKEEDEALKKKARRAEWILYGVMILFIVLPFIMLWLRKQNYL